MGEPHFPLPDITLPLDPELQRELESIDSRIRARYSLRADQVAVGVLDLQRRRCAMLRADDLYYGASVPKIGILLAFFVLNREAATDLPGPIHRELGFMIKASSNEAASRFSKSLGLAAIQQVLAHYDFYDAARGGGIWMGKHYGQDGERVLDPVGGHSHAATVRQLIRFYYLLEQGALVSPAVSGAMRRIFESPQIPHDAIKFVAGLAGRPVDIIRKWGTWEDWFHDTAVITGPGRHYILVALTHHLRGDDYLVELAPAVDDLLGPTKTPVG